VGQLGLIKRHDHAEDADAETSNGTARVQVRQRLGARLQSTTEAEYEGANHDGPPTPELVTHGPRGGGSEEGTTCEHRHDSCSEK